MVSVPLWVEGLVVVGLMGFVPQAKLRASDYTTRAAIMLMIR
jgi:hypothetical protein